VSGRKLIFSVTLKDCDVQEFRAGGPGGQNQNKRNTGIRIIHRESGARGESREQRSQLQNKRAAFKRMVESPAFKIWLARQSYHYDELTRLGDLALPWNGDTEIREDDIVTEVRRNGRWVRVDKS
jgi:hypothetical protein